MKSEKQEVTGSDKKTSHEMSLNVLYNTDVLIIRERNLYLHKLYKKGADKMFNKNKFYIYQL